MKRRATRADMAAKKKRVRKRSTVPGTWILAARTDAGMRQSDLAKLLRSHVNSVGNWERTEADYTVWLAVLSVLGLPPNWKPTKPTK